MEIQALVEAIVGRYSGPVGCRGMPLRDFVFARGQLRSIWVRGLVEHPQHISRKQGEILLDGANPSAEDGDEGTDEYVESGLDLVLNQRLVETGFSKNDYKSYLKSYTKMLQDKWKEVGKSDDEINHAKAKITEAVKKILPKLSDVQFFLGESSNPDGMVAILEYRDDGNGEKPYMMFMKHGLEEEKV